MYLIDVRWCYVDIFQLLRCNIFSLCKLKDIFGSVNNLDGTVWQNNTDVTRQEPTIDYSLFILLRVFEVSIKYSRALETDLAARIRRVSWCVSHFWNITEPNFHAGKWSSAMTWCWIIWHSRTRCCAWLCLSITLYDWTTESYLEEIEHFHCDWSWSSGHDSNFASKNVLEFFAHLFDN